MNRLVRITKTLKDKGLIVKESEVKDLIDDTTSFYQSLYYYGDDVLTYFRSNKSSIKGYKGKVSTPYITFDLDSKDLEVSKKNTIILIDWLKDQGLYNEYAAKIAFSGSKGFHLTLNTSYEFTPKELKSLCMYISSQVPFIEEAGFLRVDPSIYNINRQFRIVNTLNEKSKLYKIEMVESELRNCTMETIKEAASKPQRVYPFEAIIDDKPIRAILLQLAENSKDKYETPKTGVIKTLIGAATKRKHCIEIIQDGDMKDGESNSGLLRLASHYRRLGYTQEQCREKLVEAGENRLKKYPLTNRFDDDKLDNEILYPVYSTEGYIFTCEDWFLKMKCEGACNIAPKLSTEPVKKPVNGFLQSINSEISTPKVEAVKKPVVSGFNTSNSIGSFKSSMIKQSAGDVMKSSGFKTIKQSSDSFRSFADDWQKYRVMTGIKDIDDIVRMLPTGLVIINARPGVAKCLGKGTEVRMFDGTLKKVEDIVVGDLVMGPDSNSRLVTSLARGREEMFRVNQKYGMSYEVNRSHILSLKNPESGIHNISVNDFLKKSTRFQVRSKGWKSGFELPFKHVNIDPYFLGIWLGDGHSELISVTNMDSEIVNYMEQFASASYINMQEKYKCGKAYTYTFTGDNGSLKSRFRDYSLLMNKHIPLDYKANSRQVRLDLLAGLLDSDGHLNSRGDVFRITQKNKALALDIQEIAQSLGFRASFKEIKGVCGQTKAVGIYYSVHITGDLKTIPTKLPRKQATCKGFNHTNSQISLTSLGEGDYYGFTLEGSDRLFLLKDGTVTHNTTLLLNITENTSKAGKTTLVYSIDMGEDEFFTKSKSKALKISPDDVLDLYFNKDEEAVSLQKEGDKLTEEMLKNVYINYESKITPEKIDSDITAFKEAGINIELVIIDYLQKMDGCGDFTSPRIGATLMGLKAIQAKHKVCMIGLSQIPRTGGTEETPVLTAAAAKGGSVYEENASIVINLWRPMKFYKNESGSQDKYLGVMVAKNRMGDCKQLVLKFKGAISEIRSLTDEEREEYEITVEERRQREQPKISRGFGNV